MSACCGVCVDGGNFREVGLPKIRVEKNPPLILIESKKIKIKNPSTPNNLHTQQLASALHRLLI